ncbi:hypothetical protein KEM55_000877, partial [Ascosphaera atra]
RRAPSRLTPSASNPNLRASVNPYTGRPNSTAGADYFPQPGIQGGLLPNLPVFARSLPQDPYYGAGLVNQNPRESLAMGGGAQQPVSGLVGVIANEERARANRRGSPNYAAAANNGPMYTGMQPAGMMRQSAPIPPSMGMGMGVGSPSMRPGTPGPANQQFLSPMPEAQMHMSMMQTQIQWMDRMMRMQNINGGGGAATQTPQPPQPQALPQRMSASPVFGDGMPSPRMMRPAPGQRTMSMLDPGMHNRLSAYMPSPPPPSGIPPPGGRPGYAASVAPSERSNVGAASRYRPVSTLMQAPPPQQQQMHPPFQRSSTVPVMEGGSAGLPMPPTPGYVNGGSSSPRGSISSRHAPAGSVSSVAAAPGQQPQPGPPARTWSTPEVSVTAATPRTGAAGHDSEGSPNGSVGRNEDDEDDDQGWAEMMKRREQRRNAWKLKKTVTTGNITEIAT